MQTTKTDAEKILCNLVHDLRQPLGTIEIITYLLNQLWNDAPQQVREYLVTIERQIDIAARTLDQAAAEFTRLNGPQPSADFELSHTASVT
jgi:signal transduction histidine kinase